MNGTKTVARTKDKSKMFCKLIFIDRGNAEDLLRLSSYFNLNRFLYLILSRHLTGFYGFICGSLLLQCRTDPCLFLALYGLEKSINISTING